MANRWLERYLEGERVEVWREMQVLGPAVRAEPHFPDAVSVAAETMKRARHNVEALIAKLDDLGYKFGVGPPRPDLSGIVSSVAQMFGSKPFAQPGFQPRNEHEAAMARLFQGIQGMQVLAAPLGRKPDEGAESRRRQETRPALNDAAVFDPPTEETPAELDRLERALGGPLPLSLRAWYEHVGDVDLTGEHEALGPAGGAVASDPLVVYPFMDQLESEYGEDLDFGGERTIDLVLAPDDLHKAHTSGGEPYVMTIPDQSADGLLLNERHDATFVEYLRIVFAWGGFPGWERAEERPQKELDFLREGLLLL